MVSMLARINTLLSKFFSHYNIVLKEDFHVSSIFDCTGRNLAHVCAARPYVSFIFQKVIANFYASVFTWSKLVPH